MPFEEAVETAVDDCIRNGILADFLLKNRTEAIEVSIFEYDEEKHLKNEREYAYREGKAEGEEIGEQRGRKEGKIEGIRILIRGYLEEGISKERILKMLGKFYSLSREEAEVYYTEIECGNTKN